CKTQKHHPYSDIPNGSPYFWKGSARLNTADKARQERSEATSPHSRVLSGNNDVKDLA
ncbi:unnamed protein product, partial [Ixodes pacificus]